jgi:lipoate-protein ligase A
MNHSFLHSTRRFFTTNIIPKAKPKVHFLDLKHSGLSAIERLCLEEALLRHDPWHRNWAIVGTHDPTYQQFLSFNNGDDGKYYEHCIIVMGIGGKPDELLNLEKVREDNVLVVKRFSGGGTVVLDHHSLWTSFIGRTVDFPDVEPFPRSIMGWSASCIFERVFDRMKSESVNGTQTLKTLMIDTKSCGLADQTRKAMVVDSKVSKDPMNIPDFQLRENDYVLGEKKIGGNAQSIVKGGWLHHTSFLWDYDQEHMSYLSLPKKQPEYRNNRNHDDFLAKLKVYSSNSMNSTETKAKQAFFEHIRDVCSESFDLHHASLDDAMEVIHLQGGIEKWFEDGCRTRVMEV